MTSIGQVRPITGIPDSYTPSDYYIFTTFCWFDLLRRTEGESDDLTLSD